MSGKFELKYQTIKYDSGAPRYLMHRIFYTPGSNSPNSMVPSLLPVRTVDTSVKINQTEGKSY